MYNGGGGLYPGVKDLQAKFVRIALKTYKEDDEIDNQKLVKATWKALDGVVTGSIHNIDKSFINLGSLEDFRHALSSPFPELRNAYTAAYNYGWGWMQPVWINNTVFFNSRVWRR